MKIAFTMEWLDSICVAFFGAVDGLLYALIILVVLDYVTGVCVAIHNRKLSSSVGAKGITKKVMVFALISLSHIMDEYLIKSGDALRVITTTFYLANEGISIIENAGNIGIPLPDRLKECVELLREKSKKINKDK